MKRRLSLVLVVAMIQLVCVSSSFAAPIHYAARDGNLAEVTRLIAENRANANAPDAYGIRPLHWAARNGYTLIVQALVADGADVEAVTECGNTPLHWAACRGQTAVVHALVASGADVNATNRIGFTALQSAQTSYNAATIAALQPEAIAQLHTQTALSHTTAGNHALAARSHTWAAQALPGTEEESVSYTRAAESHTQHAHAQAAALDFASAIATYQLAQATHTHVGNHDSAQLSQAMANCYSSIVEGQRHAQAMETHFETAVIRVGEMRSHRDRGDEDAALFAEAQAQESLSAADRSTENAISAFDAALVALDGVLVGAINAHNEAAAAQVANEPAAHLAQHAATKNSLRAHIEGVSRKIDETRARAAAGHASVSAARGI